MSWTERRVERHVTKLHTNKPQATFHESMTSRKRDVGDKVFLALSMRALPRSLWPLLKPALYSSFSWSSRVSFKQIVPLDLNSRKSSSGIPCVRLSANWRPHVGTQAASIEALSMSCFAARMSNIVWHSAVRCLVFCQWPNRALASVATRPGTFKSSFQEVVISGGPRQKACTRRQRCSCSSAAALSELPSAAKLDFTIRTILERLNSTTLATDEDRSNGPKLVPLTRNELALVEHRRRRSCPGKRQRRRRSMGKVSNSFSKVLALRACSTRAPDTCCASWLTAKNFSSSTYCAGHLSCITKRRKEVFWVGVLVRLHGLNLFNVQLHAVFEHLVL